MRLTRSVIVLLLLLSVTLVPARSASRSGAGEYEHTVGSLIPLARLSVNVVDMYNAWNLETSGLSRPAFESAITGYNRLGERHQITNEKVLTIIDYSKPSSQKRLYVLDMESGEVVFNTLVAHGRNSGLEYATDFSNEESSYKTSLGFYITMNTYYGDNGYSLKLKGCDKGFNDNAYSRAIVFHGADYVSNEFIRTNGYLGRSFGCPAVSVSENKKIIDRIKNGSCLFLYYPNRRYLSRSKILNGQGA
jgi:hypothetical protein